MQWADEGSDLRTALEIRAMTAADVGEVVELLNAGGWGGRRELLAWTLSTPAIQPLVGVRDGRLVATGQAAINGSVGWVGSIFVEESLRRQGLGRAMTEAACKLIDSAGCRTQALIASDLGRPLYAEMGFRVDATYRIYEAPPRAGPPEVPAGTCLRRMRADDLERVGQLYSRATGEDRRGLLGGLVERGWLLETERGEELRGFAISILPESGAIVAPDPDDGACLLDLLRHLAAGRVRLVRAAAVTTHSTGLRMLEGRGWEWRFETPRMLRGPAPQWDPRLIWSLLGFAFG